MAIALQVSNLTKIYKVYKHRQLLAAQPLQLLRRSADGHLLYALNDVSFEIEKGEIFGIIGHNGSGKSTLLKILSGITTQNSGSFSAEGRITSLLELGVGFEPEMTGRENIYLYGSLIGLDRTTIEAREHEIIEFSGIERFIDAPVKSYSSGMLIRLAFATAIHTQPDILLLDEVLGVGDDEFRHRSFQAIQKAVERGVTVVIVSHGLTFVGNFCSRVMCLNQGEVAAIGPAEHVIQTYMDMISARDMICEIGCDSTRLRFMPGGFHIEHAQKVYTVVRGCSVNLRKWEADFLSSEASFEVLDLKPDKVRLKLSWGHWNLEQLWTLRLDDPRTIRWEIENGPNLHENVDSFEIEIMVSGVFRTYILPEEFREFPETINRGFNMEYLLAQQQPRHFLGVTDASDQRRSIILDCRDAPVSGSSMVISGGNLMPGHILKREFSANPDESHVTVLIHLFNPDELNAFFTAHKHKLGVTSGALSLVKRDAHLHLLLNHRQLTRSFGLAVVLTPGTLPAESDWEIIDTPDTLILRATHRSQPVVAVWTLRGNDSGIEWGVTLEVLEKINVFLPEIQLALADDIPAELTFSPSPVFDTTQGIWILPSHFKGNAPPDTPGRIDFGSGIIRMEVSPENG